MGARVPDSAPGRKHLGDPMTSGCRTLSRRRRAAALSLSLFVLAIRPSVASDIPSTWTGVRKVVVIGDLHGDYENFEKIIKGTGLVDSGLHWMAGDTHFVQTGRHHGPGAGPEKDPGPVDGP